MLALLLFPFSSEHYRRLMASSWHLKCSIPMARFKGRAQSSISLPTGGSHRGGGASPQLDVIDIFRLESISCRLVSPAFLFLFIPSRVGNESEIKARDRIGSSTGKENSGILYLSIFRDMNNNNFLKLLFRLYAACMLCNVHNFEFDCLQMAEEKYDLVFTLRYDYRENVLIEFINFKHKIGAVTNIK